MILKHHFVSFIKNSFNNSKIAKIKQEIKITITITNKLTVVYVKFSFPNLSIIFCLNLYNLN